MIINSNRYINLYLYIIRYKIINKISNSVFVQDERAERKRLNFVCVYDIITVCYFMEVLSCRILL
jgi:hypothetical protein